MKLVTIISEYNPKVHPGKAGMVEAIVKLKDGSVVTRHIYPVHAAKEAMVERVTEQEQS